LTSSAIPPLPCSAAADYEVTAVTRRPRQVPPRKRLALVRADARDAAAVDGAVAGSDAVLSALGVSYTRNPVSVYLAGTSNIIAAIGHHGVWRLAMVGTAAVDPGYRASDPELFTRVMSRCSCGSRAGPSTPTTGVWRP